LDAGFRHEAAVETLGRQHGKDAGFFYRLDWDPRLAAAVRNAHDAADLDPAAIGYYAFLDGLVTEQLRKIELVASPHIRQLYVDGGFSKNAVFMGMLKEKLTGWEVRAAEVGQATALGAAVVLHGSWNAGELPDGLIRY
jgi:glycerol kinase